MRTIVRAIRSMLRHPLRSVLVATLLGLGVGMTLSMLLVDTAVDNRIGEIRAEFGTDIELRPAGIFGGAAIDFTPPSGASGSGSGAGGVRMTNLPTIPNDLLDQIEKIDGVRTVQRTAQAEYSGDDLESSFTPPPGITLSTEISLPISVFGADSPWQLSVPGGGVAAIIDGTTFADDQLDAPVAILGANLAEQNGLEVGSTFEAGGETVEVIGIYDAGQDFGNNSMFMPLGAVQRFFGLEGATEARVFAEDTGQVEAIAEEIRALAGDNVVDVVTATEQVSNFAGYLNQASQDSRTGLYASLIGSALVIVIAVGLASRQRMREMGILKAIGASHTKIVGQFGFETLALSIVAGLIGALLTFPIAERVSTTVVDTPVRGPNEIIPLGSDLQPLTPTATELVISVSSDVFVYALALAIGLALVASIVTTWYVIRVKPMEVLRGA